jgi:hypothetical protein
MTPVTDLLDVFTSYDGSVIFRGLTDGYDGQPPVLGRLGWIFTAGGAVFVLWGFVLRTRRSGGDEKLGEVVKTWIILGCMVGSPFMMRTAMEAADGVYASSAGGPANLATACVKAAYAMPELNHLFDILARNAAAPAAPSAGAQHHAALLNGANDGSVLGYVEAYGVHLWDVADDLGGAAAQGWNALAGMATLATGFGSAMLKCLLIALTVLPLYLLLLAAAAVVWFMQQLRFFFAVSGAMMLPLFVGMFSLPEGHGSRQAAQGYVMNMVSLALWPVAWAIGHTGTIALYDALISLIAGTSRVPELANLLQWNAITGGAPTEAQLQATETALGNWFMGNLSGLLSILVGALGFVLWVVTVSVFGPVFLHRLLTTGALFMAQAAAGAGRLGWSGGKQANALAEKWAAAKVAPLSAVGPVSGGLVAKFPALGMEVHGSRDPPPHPGGDSLAEAARRVDNSDGKPLAPM